MIQSGGKAANEITLDIFIGLVVRYYSAEFVFILCIVTLFNIVYVHIFLYEV
jgi:hypothetical protein